MKKYLTEQDYTKAAKSLGCEVAALKAVVSVEASGEGFLDTGEPKILYEPHIFSRLTDRKYDKSHPKLSYRKWKTLPYGPVTAQHSKLAQASSLDREAALQSCSWGTFQIMGFNWKACGYKSLQAFINAMYRGVDGHLEAFLGYIKTRGLADELQRLDWAGFAYGYNGEGYKVNRYDERMEKAYNRFKREGA